MTIAQRDLASAELWDESLARSLRRRQLVPGARRQVKRRKRLSIAVAAATMAGPGTPMAMAQASGDLQAEVAAQTPSKRAIEVREGGLPLMVGSQGPLVAEVQQALRVRRRRHLRARDRRGGARLPVQVGPGCRRHRRAEHVVHAVRPGGSRRIGRAAGRARAHRAAPRERGRAAGGRRRPRGRSGAAERPGARRRPGAGAHRKLRLVDNRHAGQRDDELALRPARRPQPRWRGHRGADRHAGAFGGVRQREHRRSAERLREHRLRHAHEPVLHVLRAPVAASRRARARRSSRVR